MNRISTAVARMEQVIAGLTPEQTEKVSKTADLDAGEWLALGDLASRGRASDRLTLDEAVTLKAIHGDCLNDFLAQPVAHRLVFIKAATELLGG